jgi:sulfate permease, SulP family
MNRMRDLVLSSLEVALEYKLPAFEWLSTYQLDYFYSDVNAGATVFVLLIPQAMAYSVLAGLPPVYGLYTSTVALFVYSVFGYSRQLAIGPFAITSLLSAAAVSDLGYDPDNDTEKFISASLSLALYAGLILVAMGLLRLGSLTNFLSQSVLTGFISGSAAVIALSQLKYVLGMTIDRKAYSHQIIYEICVNIENIQVYGTF